MTSLRSVLAVLPMWAAACSGTSTGNPMNPDDGSGGPPEGATVLFSDAPRAENPSLSAADAAAFGAANREFTFDLYRELSDPTQNLFFSPYSISVALAMTLPGAEGDTETEIREALHFELPEPELHSAFDATTRAILGRSEELAEDASGDGFDLAIVNQAWGQNGYPFLDSYLDVLAVHYGTGLYGVEFADSENTRTLINDWVSDQTEARIPDLLPQGSLSGDTRLVLTNAVYFKASWLLKFNPADTAPGTFQAPAGERTPAMMHKVFFAQYAEGSGYQALELPYVSDSVRMLLILPETDLETFAAGLNDALFSEIRAALIEYQITLAMPKFEFEASYEMAGALSALGMPTAFTPDADFTAIAGGVEPLWIDEVYHDSFVAVDEEGTEAAAATAVVITTVSTKPIATLTLDRPFLFAIYDEPTGQILFLGQLADPG